MKAFFGKNCLLVISQSGRKGFMELTIARSEFYDALQRCQSVIPARGAMSILSYILLQAKTEGVYLSATDLEVTIRYTASARVEREGSITLLARKIFEIVRELPEEEIRLKAEDDNKVRVYCGQAEFVLAGLPVEDFPSLPEYEDKEFFLLDGPTISEMVRRVIFAIPTQEIRYSLTGALVALEDGVMHMVGTDGHRLAWIRKPMEGLPEGSQELILPKKILAELKRAADEAEEPISTSFQDKYVVFMTGRQLMIGRLIEGAFPNYRQVIPEETSKQVVIDREAFIHAIRRVSLLSDEKSHSVRLRFCNNQLYLNSQDSEIGDAKETLQVEYSGEDFIVGFNASYMLDALSAIDTEQVYLELNDPLGPCLFKPSEGEDYVCVIMPMKVD